MGLEHRVSLVDQEVLKLVQEGQARFAYCGGLACHELELQLAWQETRACQAARANTHETEATLGLVFEEQEPSREGLQAHTAAPCGNGWLLPSLEVSLKLLRSVELGLEFPVELVVEQDV